MTLRTPPSIIYVLLAVAGCALFTASVSQAHKSKDGAWERRQLGGSVPSGRPKPSQNVALTTLGSPRPDSGGARPATSGSLPVATPVAVSPAAAGTNLFVSHCLINEKGEAVKPADILAGGNDLYFLGADTIWKLPGGVQAPGDTLKLETLRPPCGKVGNVPVQEFLSFTWFAAHRSVVILDKSGSLFELAGDKWRLLRANFPIGSPDPHYISVASAGDHVLLLDPERNQIWRVPAGRFGARYFKDVLPWRIKAGDPNVTNGISLAFDGAAYVARCNGSITRYPADAHGGNGGGRSVWKAPPALRPSRLATAHGAELYLVERENNRVIRISKAGGAHTFFDFPGDFDLRGLLPSKDGFWVINSSRIVFRPHDSGSKIKARPETRRIDERLDGLIIPVPGASLPGHTGVYPGARRAYRYGVHAGLDFFADPGRGTHVTMNTPAVAAEAGKVIRADVRYKDMDARRYSTVMTNCARSHYCSEENEDLFRGCQVWLDHGNGLVTRYAHLNSARPDLTVGKLVGRGETIGYIGVSGTGENLPGRVKHPHLHFEIWLDDHYLGWGLNLAETMALYENVFGRACAKRGNKQ